jgi:hypothetical protein
VPPSSPVTPAISARIIHGALVLGVMLFWGAAWYIGTRYSMPVSAIPDRRFLYLGLFLFSGIMFGAAVYTAGRLTPPTSGISQDAWWQANLGRAIVVWALVETPALVGTAVYLLTRDFRTLIAPFVGLLLFVNYRPSRLFEG